MGSVAVEARLIEELSKAAIPLRVDERGVVVDLSRFCIRDLHVVTMEPGALRGNHMHDRDEIVCVVGGGAKCELTGEDEVSGECERIIVEGNLKTYRIKAGVKHAFKNFSEDTFFLVCFYGSLSSSS